MDRPKAEPEKTPLPCGGALCVLQSQRTHNYPRNALRVRSKQENRSADRYDSTRDRIELRLVPCRRNNIPFVAIKMGRRQGARSGAYLNRYVTEEQCGRRPIFIATLRAAASWLLFHVARSLRIDLDMLVARALKSGQLTCGERHAISAIGH